MGFMLQNMAVTKAVWCEGIAKKMSLCYKRFLIL
jgi:hypothetical protein